MFCRSPWFVNLKEDELIYWSGKPDSRGSDFTKHFCKMCLMDCTCLIIAVKQMVMQHYKSTWRSWSACGNYRSIQKSRGPWCRLWQISLELYYTIPRWSAGGSDTCTYKQWQNTCYMPTSAILHTFSAHVLSACILAGIWVTMLQSDTSQPYLGIFLAPMAVAIETSLLLRG